MNSKKWLSSLMILTLGLSLLTGCNKNPNTGEIPPESVTPVETTTPVEEAAVNPYAKIIETYSNKIGYLKVETEAKTEAEQQALVEEMKKLKKSGAKSIDIFKLYQDNIEGLRAPYSDDFAQTAISGLRLNSFNDYVQTEKYFNVRENLDEYFDEAEKYAFSYLDLKREADKIADPELKKIMADAAAQGYELISAEGMVFPVVDFTEFAKYKELYSPEFAAVLDQFSYSNVQILVSDGGLVASLDHMAARIFQAENELKNASDSKYQKYLAMIYADNFTLLLFGTNNSPAYDYETLKIREEMALLFKQMSTETDSKTATYIQMHMAVLEASEGKYDEATTAKINELINKIRSDFKVTEADETSFQNWMSGTQE